MTDWKLLEDLSDSFMKFICDTMLGKLTKYLRIVGIDASYSSSVTLSQIITLAMAEHRTILTRRTDHQLLKHSAESYFILSNYPFEQLQDVFIHFNLQADSAQFFTRCLSCNQPIVAVDKDSVADSVPPYVFCTASEFARCPQCAKIYWKGTHYGNMLKRLEMVLEAVKDGTG
jgi:uncharacterized protein